ncbi:ATP-binding protein [Kozakia baliensis]|uniref:ATP-binding protein n=1 Tax=Kozakia baliensis TaxID=153496 RepID=UPI00068E64DC|nr:ATP-binding protein [Kozakia baliensis]
MRRIVDMQPTRLQKKQAEDPVDRLKEKLGNTADVRAPADAEEPILSPSVRTALYQWMSEIRAKKDLEAVGVKPRTNALLYGPPGCGKTTLAHHFAARLGIPLVVVGAENIWSSGLGDSELKVAKLFNGLIEANTPCVLFIDELEAIGGTRSANTGGSADNARTSVLTVLLRKVEEFACGYLLGATNRPDDIDPALWRRFNMQIAINLPGEEERFAIVRRYGLPYAFSDDDIDILTNATDGASPALLRELMEGVKRTLVVRPRMNMPIDDPIDIFGSIIAATMPPPEMETPKLWRGSAALSPLAEIAWPPSRKEN